MKALLVLAGVALVIACVPVPVKYWEEAAQAPKPGDLVRVETLQGKRHRFRVYKTDATAFYGIGTDDLKYRVPYGALKSIELRKTDVEWAALPLLNPAGLGPPVDITLGR
jgi:hypothetical protein